MPQSFGEAEIHIDQFHVGSIVVRGVHGIPALGPELRFVIGLRMLDLRKKDQWAGDRPEIVGYELIDLEGRVSLRSGVHVGILQRDGPKRRISSVDGEHERQLTFDCPLDLARLDRLEEHREGKPLELRIDFYPTIVHENQPLNATCGELQALIPREEWIGVLSSLRKDQFELLEVQFDSAYANRFRASLGELKKARGYVDQGDYPAAIVRCRKAMEILTVTTRQHSPESAFMRDTFRPIVGDRRAKAYSNVLRSVKDMGNIELHDMVEHGYSRTEALFAIQTGELLLNLIGSLLTRPRPQLEE